MQPSSPCRRIPLDIAVAIGALPGRGTENQASHGSAIPCPRQILEVLSNRAAKAQIVKLMEEAFAERSVSRGTRTDLSQVERQKLGERAVDWRFHHWRVFAHINAVCRIPISTA